MKKNILIAIFVIAIFNITNSQNINDSLILYWPFDGDSKDLSINNIDGIIYNAELSLDRNNKANSAYYFNGSDSYIEIPNNDKLKPELPLTIALWVKFEDLDYNYSQIFITDYVENSYYGVWFGLNPVSRKMQISYGSGIDGCTSSQCRRTKEGTTTIDEGQWYYVVGVIKGPQDMDIYINCANDQGIYDGTGENIAYTNQSGSIGRVDQQGVDPYYFKGWLDEIKYYNRALSENEIIQLCKNEYDFVEGKVFFDSNENKIFDNEEKGLSSQKVLLLPDSIVSLTDNNGNYFIRKNTESSELKIILNNDWKLTTDSILYNFTYNNTDTTSFDFGIRGIKDTTIFENFITSLDNGRCGSIVPFYITYKNIGTSIGNGIITFYPDQKLKSIEGADPMYDSISSDTSAVYWNFNSLMPYNEKNVKLYIKMPDFNSMGDILKSISVIKIPYEVSEFTDTSSIIVRCSYDPNDKLVYPEGISEEKYTLISDYLNYTIRFQNTGNDTAYDVVIIDTLCNNFDYNSFEVLSSSHNLKVSNNNGIIEFRFDNIMLADSNISEPESHGFVKYKIKAKNGLSDNTVVENLAYIYFDYNPAVITNTTTNTLTYNLSKSIVEKVNLNSGAIVYPNPFNNKTSIKFENNNKDKYLLTVSDMTGKIIYTINTVNNIIVFEKGNLNSGMYFYNLYNTKKGNTLNGKLIIE